VLSSQLEQSWNDRIRAFKTVDQTACCILFWERNESTHVFVDRETSDEMSRDAKRDAVTRLKEVSLKEEGSSSLERCRDRAIQVIDETESG
jgi:hypothetical protein